MKISTLAAVAFAVLTLVACKSESNSGTDAGKDVQQEETASGDTGVDTAVPPADAQDSAASETLAETVDETAAETVAEVVPETVVPVDVTEVAEEVVPPADVQPETAEETAGEISEPDVFDATVTVKVGGTETPVKLNTLEKTEFEGKEAIRLVRVVEVAAIEMPWNYHYNFVAGDGFNVLVDKLEGNYAGLPYYGELEFGFIYFDEEKQTLRIGWDVALNMPGSLKVKGIGGGVIEAVEVGATNFVVKVGDVRALLDTATLPTQDVVDYKHPEDGAKPMIAMSEIFKAAAVADAATYVYKFYGMDGFSNNDDNLMPFANTEHAWYEPVKRRIILEEQWDTAVCCWSVKNTVLILGIKP